VAATPVGSSAVAGVLIVLRNTELDLHSLYVPDGA